jgi:hypothetical protein
MSWFKSKKAAPVQKSPVVVWYEANGFTYTAFVGWCCHRCVCFTPWPSRHLVEMHTEVELPDFIREHARGPVEES